MLQKKVQRGNYCRKCVKKKCKRKSTKKACFSLDLLWTCILVLKKSRIWQWLNYRKMWNLRFPILSDNSLVGQFSCRIFICHSSTTTFVEIWFVLQIQQPIPKVETNQLDKVLEVLGLRSLFVYLLLFCYLMFLASLHVFLLHCKKVCSEWVLWHVRQTF